MDFKSVKALKVPEGVVGLINGVEGRLWAKKFSYVSLGDSIAVGHRIDENWESDYGWDAQYRQKDKATGIIQSETVIVPNSYTDKIREYLYGVYGKGNVTAKSFAVSGSMIMREHGDNRSLIEILDDEPVQAALSQADLVTICIGANTILEPALGCVEEYLLNGTGLDSAAAEIEDGLRDLADPGYEYSYNALFNKLLRINPNAKYVFTTVYNPMKYLYIARGTWENDFRDGLFGAWLNTIPQMTILFGWEVDKEIKKLILDTTPFVNIFNRINGTENLDSISNWTKKHIDTGGVSANGKPYLGLNQIIRNAVRDFNSANFFVTETHELFDTVPDREGPGMAHYNDLVNVQITKGFDANDLNWRALWGSQEGATTEEKIQNYWRGIIDRHVSDRYIDIEGIANEVKTPLVEDVLGPAFDAHPGTEGQYAMYRSFADTLRWIPLKTITYNANGGAGIMGQQKVLDRVFNGNLAKSVYSITKPNAFTPSKTGHYFAKWNQAADGSGTSHSNGAYINVTSDITLYAQWARNKHTLTVVQTTQGDDDNSSILLNYQELLDADYANRRVFVNNIQQQLHNDKMKWNDSGFSDVQHISVEYGDAIKLSIQGRLGTQLGLGKEPNCTMNQYTNEQTYVAKKTGEVVSGEFIMPDRDVTIEFWFNYVPNALFRYEHRWWNAYIGDTVEVKYTASDK